MKRHYKEIPENSSEAPRHFFISLSLFLPAVLCHQILNSENVHWIYSRQVSNEVLYQRLFNFTATFWDRYNDFTHFVNEQPRFRDVRQPGECHISVARTHTHNYLTPDFKILSLSLGHQSLPLFHQSPRWLQMETQRCSLSFLLVSGSFSSSHIVQPSSKMLSRDHFKGRSLFDQDGALQLWRLIGLDLVHKKKETYHYYATLATWIRGL